MLILAKYRFGLWGEKVARLFHLAGGAEVAVIIKRTEVGRTQFHSAFHRKDSFAQRFSQSNSLQEFCPFAESRELVGVLLRVASQSKLPYAMIPAEC